MYPATLSQAAQAALALLGKSNVLPKSTYLAGGSALALHYGHRISVDFDFFTPSRFDESAIGKKLMGLGSFRLDEKSEYTLLGLFESVRFSLFRYDYPLIFKPTIFKKIAIASPKYIAVMKFAAIMDRGTKKDFVDLYFLVKKGISVESAFRFYDKKYKALANNLYSLITSLSYFEEAEKTDMPQMLVEVSWKTVKKFFQKEVKKLAERYL